MNEAHPFAHQLRADSDYNRDIQNEARADAEQREERLNEAAPEMYEVLQLARNVLFLLDDEVKAIGLRAGNVRNKIVAVLAKAAQ